MQVKGGSQVANSTFHFRAEAHSHPRQSTSVLQSPTGEIKYKTRAKSTGLGSNPRSPLLALQSQTRLNFFVPQIPYLYGVITLPIP